MRVSNIIWQVPLVMAVVVLAASCTKQCGREFKKEMSYEELHRLFDIDGDEHPDIGRCHMLTLSSGPNDSEDTPELIQQGLCGGGSFEFLVEMAGNHFLKKGDEIQVTPSAHTGLVWSTGTFELLSNWSCGGLYQETWEVGTSDELPHYMAIKKEDSTGIQLGWLELDYDLEAGTMQIVETELRSDTLLVFE